MESAGIPGEVKKIQQKRGVDSIRNPVESLKKSKKNKWLFLSSYYELLLIILSIDTIQSRFLKIGLTL